jgi:lycopene cyclase domain-containing protein
MTYAVLNLVVLALLVALAAVLTPRLRRLRGGPLVWTALVMLALTAVFDSVMIGIGLVSYDPAKIVGVYVGRAPVEDFAYTLAAVALMPVAWTLLGARPRRAGPSDRSRGTDS